VVVETIADLADGFAERHALRRVGQGFFHGGPLLGAARAGAEERYRNGEFIFAMAN
jgi:hypothetical protein